MKIENLKYLYNSNLILDIENLEFDTSKITALMGANGSGKSTLLRVISGIEKPFSGEIKSNLKSKEISILLPEPVLLKRSVKKNFEFALGCIGALNEFNDRVYEALNFVGLDKSFLNKKYYELSSGQTQRVAFGIVLSLRSKLIILDEPTNSVDLSTAKNFSKAIKYMNDNYKCGFIISSHDEKWLSAIADESIFLYGGRLAKFEYKNIFKISDGKIKFGKGLDINLPSNLAKFSEVAINLNLIEVSKLKQDEF